MAGPDTLSGDVLRLVLAWPLVWAIGYGFGYFILKPLREAALKPPPPTQYRLPDLFVLLGVFFLAGVPIALSGQEDERLVFAALLFIWSLCIAWWWWGLRMLSRAAVSGRARRIVCLGAAMPFVCGGSAVFVLVPVCFLHTVARHGVEGRQLVWGVALVALPVWLGLGVALFVGGRFLARWLAKGARPGAPPARASARP